MISCGIIAKELNQVHWLIDPSVECPKCNRKCVWNKNKMLASLSGNYRMRDLANTRVNALVKHLNGRRSNSLLATHNKTGANK